MSKTKLLLDVISNMRSLADSLEAAANAMCDSQPAPNTVRVEVPTADKSKADTPSYTLEEVRAVLSKKSAEGHGAQIRELLGKYGHSRLSEIDPKDYPALLADAEVL